MRTKRGIGIRIARLVAATTFLAVMVAAIVQTIIHADRQIDNRMLSMESTAIAMASAAGEAAAANDSSKAQAALTAASRIKHILMATVLNADGTVLASLGQSTGLQSDMLVAADGKLAMLYKGQVAVSVDIVKGGAVRGKMILLGDISGLRKELILSVLSTLAASLIAAMIGVAASRPLQRRIVQPLATLTQTIETLRNSRDYSTNLADDNTPDETGVLVKSFNSLMSDIRFRDNALQQLAYNDPLTGLPNRVSFQRTIDDHIVQRPDSLKGCIVLMNIHGFRALNDAFSHSIGDAVLMTVAAAIKSAIREDVTLARYSGDEFALLLRETETEAEVDMAVARVQSAFFKPLQISDLELHVNLTAGAFMLADNTPSDESLRYVDMALAEAKKNMSGRVQFFRNELAEIVRQETALGQALRQSAKAGAFELHYQPQLDFESNRISGYEALLRWKHPIRGNISPAVFIPLAERIGLVSVIGDWVLLEGCKQAAAWNKQGHPNRIMSINVSLAQILTAGFVEKVRGALRKSGLPPEQLCVELTESIFAGSRYADIIIILETLAKDGVKLALDDFGTGYSSLGYLSKLPFHSIKIDRSFVTDADKSVRKSGMLKSIVEMIHALGMSVVAEGAETPEELALLRKLNVNKVQGYVVAKPMPAEIALQQANTIDQSRVAMSA